jgi:hypothetical protein
MKTVGCEQFEELSKQIVQLRPELAANERLDANLASLVDWLDKRFLKMSIEAGAKQVEVADSIEESLLAAAGYFESFSPDRLVKRPDGKLRSPAACYQCYPVLSEVELEEAGLWTCRATCGRNEAERGIGRLQTFRMREIVLVGSSSWVRRERGRWIEKIGGFARSLGLDIEVVTASDSFFGAGEAQGRKLIQQLKELKFEMQVRIGQAGPTLAIVSFNLHESFFAERFRLSLRRGTEAYSGCVAFGLDRWVLALVDGLGPAQAFKLVAEECA